MPIKTLEEIIAEANILPAIFRKVADDGLHQKWWRSLPIPGLYKPIKFESLYQKLDKIINLLDQKMGEIHSLSSSISSQVERAYVIVLIEEYSAFRECAKRLRVVFYGLYQKSKGSQGSPYTYEKYHQDLRSYEEAAMNYYSASRKADEFIKGAWDTENN